MDIAEIAIERVVIKTLNKLFKRISMYHYFDKVSAAKEMGIVIK